MKTQRIPHTEYEASRLIYGCMMTAGDWEAGEPTAEACRNTRELVETAQAAGINFFDHADIYSRGKAEKVFGRLFREGLQRDGMIIQTKCGIRFGDEPPGTPHRYDFSYEHIVASAEGSLQRLGCGHIDILLLHRPDVLMEPEEIARAFDDLHASGKVRHFGVSNFTPAQMELLGCYLDRPLVVNQIRASLWHTQPFDSGIVAGRDEPGFNLRGDDTLDYCRLNDTCVQAYSPLAQGMLAGPAPADAEPRLHTIRDVLGQLAPQYGVSEEALAIAFLLRHPAQIQPILGTTKPHRLRSLVEADNVELSREDWYRLYLAGRGRALP